MITRDLLETVLIPGAVAVRFHPILQREADGWHLFGLECLTRGPAGTNLERADILFEYARRKRATGVVDTTCCAAALAEAAKLPGNPMISVNVHAATLSSDESWPDTLLLLTDSNEIDSSRVIVELVEHVPSRDGPGLLEGLHGLRSRGFVIALDDIGEARSNYRMIVDCEPEIFKIGGYVVDGVHQDPRRRAVLDSVVHLAANFGSRVVAEGVENIRDLQAVADVGIDLIQGYVFSKPLARQELLDSVFLTPGKAIDLELLDCRW